MYIVVDLAALDGDDPGRVLIIIFMYHMYQSHK